MRRIAVGIGGTILVLLWVAGCDWFEAQPEENLAPQTDLLKCGAVGGVNAGGNAKFVWTGSDIDGSVISYQYSYDDLDWVSTPGDSTVIESVALGSHTFEVRAVDDKGEADPEPAKCAFVAGELVARSTLIEFLTTNTCRNCPTAEAALDSLLGDFGSDRLAVIAYHDLTQTDGLATGETVSRIDWYTDYSDIPEDQWPISIFDGLRTVEGAISVEQAISEYGFEVGQRLAAGSPVRLTIEGEIGSTAGSVEVVAKVTGVVPAHQLVLKFAVIEDDVRYNGYFAKIFDAVARDLLDDEPLSLEAIGDSVTVERSFPVAETWTLDNLDVIAFIQDIDTREVIQSARLRHEELGLSEQPARGRRSGR
jgi:hypothetical protein